MFLIYLAAVHNLGLNNTRAKHYSLHAHDVFHYYGSRDLPNHQDISRLSCGMNVVCIIAVGYSAATT